MRFGSERIGEGKKVEGFDIICMRATTRHRTDGPNSTSFDRRHVLDQMKRASISNFTDESVSAKRFKILRDRLWAAITGVLFLAKLSVRLKHKRVRTELIHFIFGCVSKNSLKQSIPF